MLRGGRIRPAALPLLRDIPVVMRKLATTAARTAMSASMVAALAAACSKADPSPPAPASAATTTAAPAATAAEPGADGKHRRKHEDRHDPKIADVPLQLVVAVDGAVATWRQDAFDKVTRFTGNNKASDGEARDVWSLRELAHALVGPAARVTSVTGEDGTKTIDRAAWDDASRTPLLHTTRRGTLKFRWADNSGAWSDSEIKDVTRIEIAR
jgi:hypothetical protein